IGWRHIRHAKPNRAHLALAQLEREGRVELLVTQNVDCLHEAAGSRNVVDLHGRLDAVRCMTCGQRLPREDFQQRWLDANPSWVRLDAREAPDGDADLEGRDFGAFKVPACQFCEGVLKPDVVFFGESVPRDRVDRAMRGVQDADAMLVVGTSLMVYSGYRFAQAAADAGKPIVAVNIGRTRADHLLTLKFSQSCADALDTPSAPD